MHLFIYVLLLFSSFSEAFDLTVNRNRGFLFGDVLEPLCSVNSTSQNLTESLVIEMFHAWEKYTSSQLGSSSISEYRKAMPCFPGPNLNLTLLNNDTLPPYPNCESFVNISKATLGEVDDLLEQVKKGAGSRVDVSLKSVMNSLTSRLQNLVDYLPDGATRNKTQIILFSLINSNSSKMLPEPTPSFRPSDLLNCFDISSLPNLASISTQTVGAVICSAFQICSFSAVSSNQCLSQFNITQEQYDSIVNKTVGEVMNGKLGGSGHLLKTLDSSVLGKMYEMFTSRGQRSKRTVEPEDVTTSWNESELKMDGREEFGSGEEEEYHRERFDDYTRIESADYSGKGSGMHLGKRGEILDEDDLGNSTDTSDLLDQLLDPRDDVEPLIPTDQYIENSASIEQLQSLLATKLNSSLVEFGISFINDSSVQQKVSSALNGMDGDFTVSQLLDRIDVSNIEELKQLLVSLESLLGVSDLSAMSEALQNVSMKGFYLGTMLQNMFSGSSENLKKIINEKISKSGLPLSNEDILRRAVTLPMSSAAS